MSTVADKEALEALFAHNLKLLDTGEFSDFSVVCGDRTWKAHKVILCRVEYFNKLITSGFKESQESRITIPNFQPFEIDILLRYIYDPRVDAKVACLQQPNLNYLEMCVRLWQLGDYYGIETLAKSAEERLRERTERYIVEAGHVANMMRGLPFVSEMEGAIRAAWDPEKASGPQRALLLSLCQAAAPYLRNYPKMIALFDEIPQFASEFIKTVLGCGVTLLPSRSRVCEDCRDDISTKDARLRKSQVICHSPGTLAPEGSFGGWYCSRECYKDAPHARFKHDHCTICKLEESEQGG